MQIEADPSGVLQALKDPLMHILRNTIAPRLSTTPAERKAAGKRSGGPPSTFRSKQTATGCARSWKTTAAA